MAKNKTGAVYLVGAGPGDPSLLTLRGARLLGRADAVVYDRLVNPALLELAPRAEKIYAGKKSAGGSESVLQQRTNRLLSQLAKAGKRVVRLKGGDPFIFGRGGEEALYLKKAGVRFEIVPGVSAGQAVPAYAGIPLTDRKLSSLVVWVTAHEEPGKKKTAVDWRLLARLKGTLVLFMSVGRMAETVRTLMLAGKSPETPCCVIERGTLPAQRVVEAPLRKIASAAALARIESPALTVIGEVTRLRRDLAWFENRPLAGKKVLITRARAQAGKFREMLEAEGAEVLEFPAIAILPPRDWKPLDRELKNAGAYDWVVFTSPNGVEAVMGRLGALGLDARLFAAVKIAAIGEATAQALRESGLRADFVPKTFSSESLWRELARAGRIRGRSFLLARTDIAPDNLRKALEREGGRVTEVIAYRTRRAAGPAKSRKLQEWMKQGVDYITFTSSSTAQYFFEALSPASKKALSARLVSIGPVTSKTIREHGMKIFREAKPYTLAGLVEAMHD